MATVAQVAVSGVLIGGIYAMVALGFTLVFGILKVFNFAHGIVLMNSGLGLYAAEKYFDTSLVLSILFGVAIGVVTSLAIKLICVDSLGSNYSQDSVLAATFAFTGAAGALAMIVMGPNDLPVPSPGTSLFQLGPVRVSALQLVALAVSMLLFGLLVWGLRTSKWGRLLQSVAQDREAALLIGIDTRKAMTISFVLAGIIGGTGGVFLGMRFGTVSAVQSDSLLLTGVAAMVIGGMASLGGTVVAAMGIGLLEATLAELNQGSLILGATWVGVLVVLVGRSALVSFTPRRVKSSAASQEVSVKSADPLSTSGVR